MSRDLKVTQATSISESDNIPSKKQPCFNGHKFDEPNCNLLEVKIEPILVSVKKTFV